MKLLPECHLFRPAALLAAALAMFLATAADGQQVYQNVVNQHFRTISNGPQSALILDVKNANDTAAVRKAALQLAQARLDANKPALQKELAFLRQHKLLKPGQKLDISDTVMVRQNGRLVLAPAGKHTRDFGVITFSFPTDPAVSGSWSIQAASKLTALSNVLYPELVSILGGPGWSGNVTVLNRDPRLGKVDEVLGALLIINGANVEIDLPSFSDDQTLFLAMAQVMAQAFHAQTRIAYDAWEQGMARAAAVIAARDIQRFNGTAIDPANGFYYTPNYDLLNQPPLANNTFTPPTKSDQTFNPTTLSGMLVPRLQMSSTAWLKCYIENPSFFAQFNMAFYNAFTADPTIANDVTRLRALAKASVPTVELQDFDSWFEHQYILDTSVTPGPKVYAYIQPTFPSDTQGSDSGAAIFVVYYQTTTTGDESDLSGLSNVVYWDYNFANRLFLPSFEKINIVNGFGTVAPFFNNIGGTPADKIRVAIDIPVNKEYTRVYFPAGQTGTQTSPNNFSGVVVGSISGALNIVFGNGTIINTPVVQGEFGGQGNVPNNFSRTRLTYTPDVGNSVTFQRNVYIRPDTTDFAAVAPIFQLVVPSPTAALSHTFPAGAQMMSLPIKPFSGNLATVLSADPNSLLLAQYRQDLQVPPNPDKYQRYPSLPLYQPGYGLWASFQTGLIANNIRGESTDNQQDISVALEFGWNQIGPPYTTNLNITTDVFVQYLGSDVVSLPEAITNGWLAAGVIGFSPTTGYNDIATTTDVSFPRNTLEAWKGYWVRVLVTEGVTLTYVNPNAPTRAAKFRKRAANTSTGKEPGGWRVPLTLRDSSGSTAGALFGQSPRGSDSFTPALDVASPPPFTRAATLQIRFPHNDWNTGTGGIGGDFLTDIRRSASRSLWNVTVGLPNAEQDYTLAWSDTALLPQKTRLTLIDMTSGTRRMMNSTSSYTFHAVKGEITRSFQIVAEPRALSRLTLQNVRADQPLQPQGRAAGMTISYELSGDAETTVEIQLAGRIVRRLAQGRAAASGVNQMVWDLKDDQGRGLPAGAYTLQITARTPEGEQTRQIVPLLMAR